MSRAGKVRRIFERFDANHDGGLNRDEMTALVVAVNPRVKFSDEQISAILDEVFRTYSEFILPDDVGLSLEGLIRTYDDGAGDVDRDFDSLNLPETIDTGTITSLPSAASSSASGLILPAASQIQTQHSDSSPAQSRGIKFDSTWKLLDDLDILIKRLRRRTEKNNTGGSSNNNNNNFDSLSEAGWSREMGPSEKKIIYNEKSNEYVSFLKEVNGLRARADSGRSREEAFDGHMAIGKALYDHQLFSESLKSFRRACEIQPTDVRPHFMAGNSLYAIGKCPEAKEEFLLALEVAEASGPQWTQLLPQIHVNLGIAMEGEGMVLGACEHYREAAILCPSHFRALKLLGSALFGVGEYKAAEKALEEAVFLRPDYADAHCDLGSALHMVGEDERAIQEFQKAIDLKPDHVDALYNLGGLYMDVGRFARASEMYTRVLSIRSNHWKAQLNKAVALLGAGEEEDARRALKDAFKLTKRVEVYDSIAHLKMLQKKKSKRAKRNEGDAGFIVIEASKFKRVGGKTIARQELANALEIRAFQRLTRLGQCDVDAIRKEMHTDVPVSYSGSGVTEKYIRKAALEVILRRILSFLKAETFLGAVKAINERILSVLDSSGSSRVDLSLFFAIIAPICSGSTDRRKRVVYDALLWRPTNENVMQIKRSDVVSYIKKLRAVYIPSHGMSEMMELHGEPDETLISYDDFLEIFDDPDWGFGILNTLVKLESGDRIRHDRHSCSVCRYPIIGSRFKETKHGFSLCSKCYSEGKVPSSCKQEEYRFKEYGRESEAMKDK